MAYNVRHTVSDVVQRKREAHDARERTDPDGRAGDGGAEAVHRHCHRDRYMESLRMPVYLENPADVPEDWVETALEACEQPSSRLLLLLTPGQGIPPERARAAVGATVDRRLLKYVQNPGDLAPFVKHRSCWQQAIVIAGGSALRPFEDRVFFTYLLGHEMRHALQCHRDVRTHLFCSLVGDGVLELLRTRVKAFNLPYEKECDRAGLKAALDVFGEDRAREHFRSLSEMPNRPDAECEWCRHLADMPVAPSKRSLRSATCVLLRRHREDLIRIWRHQEAEARENGHGHPVECIVDFDALCPSRTRTRGLLR